MDNPLETIIKLQEENRIAAQTIEDFRIEIRHLHQTIHRLEHIDSAQIIKDLRLNINNLTAERDDLSRVTDNLKADNEDLRRRNLNQTDEINAIMEDNEEYTTIIKELRDCMSDLFGVDAAKSKTIKELQARILALESTQ